METTVKTIDKTDMFIAKQYSYSYKLGATTGSQYTFSITIPEGYQIFSFSRFNTSVAGVTIGGVSPPKMRLINLGSAMSANKTAYMTVVFIKNEYVSTD